MNDAPRSGQVARIRLALAVGMVVFLAAPSFAGPISIVDTGFENPPYVAGAALGGHGGWVKSASGSTATVKSSVGTLGSQGVEVSRAANDDAYWYIPSATYPSGYPSPLYRYIDVRWDMKVSLATTQSTMYGPFFGVVAQEDDRLNIKWFGGFGVDGATGELLYTGGASGALTTVGGTSGTVGFDEWHNYKLRLDFQTDTYSLFKDDVNLLAGLPFVDSGLTCFTDADIMASAADFNGPAATGRAFYDNFSVSQVPEPSTVALCLTAVVTLALVAARRRCRKNAA
jgi:hypothetical protein